jgi:hypothetical protein
MPITIAMISDGKSDTTTTTFSQVPEKNQEHKDADEATPAPAINEMFESPNNKGTKGQDQTFNNMNKSKVAPAPRVNSKTVFERNSTNTPNDVRAESISRKNKRLIEILSETRQAFARTITTKK